MNKKIDRYATIAAGILSIASYASATTLGDEKYTYDASGNIVEKSIDGKVTKMSYDVSNKVTSTTSSGEYSGLISYDSAGRPLSKTTVSGQYTLETMYGYADKVLKTDGAGGKADFFYNADGKLIAKTVAGKNTSYIWDDNVMAAEGTKTFVNEDHISGGIPLLAGDQDVVVSDYLGNTLSQANTRFKSTAYGEGVEQGRFTGKFFVEELGSYVFHHRLYSPITLRWNTSDPIGFPDGINNLLYVYGDPLSKIDPLGTSTVYAAEESQRVDGPVNESVTVRYIYNYGKYQKPEYSPGSASLPPSNSAGWSDPSATVKCDETIPSPYPDSNLLYWKNHEDSIVGTASAMYSNIKYNSDKAFDSPAFEK